MIGQFMVDMTPAYTEEPEIKNREPIKKKYYQYETENNIRAAPDH